MRTSTSKIGASTVVHLILSINPSELKHVRNYDSSKEVWDTLKSVYTSQGPMRNVTILEQLLHKRIHEGDHIRDYLSQFMETVNKLSNIKIEINDLLSIMLLHSLSNKFDNISCEIKSRDNLPAANTLMTKIIEVNDNKIHKDGNFSSSAILSKLHWKIPMRNCTHHPRAGTGPTNTSQYKCHYCKKRGYKPMDY